MFPARSKQTVRGFTLAKTPAEKHWRQIISASQGERETCLLTLAMPNLWNLFDHVQWNAARAGSGHSLRRGEWTVAMVCPPKVAVPAAQSRGDGDDDAS